MRRVTNKTDLERFESKLDKSGECWIWKGSTRRRYGAFYFPNYPGTYSKHMVSSHRAALYLYLGVVPDYGLDVLHSCDNGMCCNPEHLSIGTHSDNMLDMVAKGRNVSHTQVLSKQDVLEARNMRAAGNAVKYIASLFGISASQMSRVTAGIQPKWKIKCSPVENERD